MVKNTIINAQIEALNAKIKHSKSEDLENFKSEIKQFLEEEIASRYYFQNGRLEASLKDDTELKEAIALLNDMDKYKKVLTTITKADKPFYNDKPKK